MPNIRKIELDVLKPHLPNVLEFSEAIAVVSPDYRVFVDVEEMDDKTETLRVLIEGKALDFTRIEEVIASMGGSVHSIDKCIVAGDDVEDC